MKNNKIILSLIITALVCSVGYIVYDLYTEYQLTHDQELVQEAMQYGASQVIQEMQRQVVTCEPMPFPVGNLTISLIAVECLQQEPQDE